MHLGLALARGYALEEMPCEYRQRGLLHETLPLRELSRVDSVRVVQLHWTLNTIHILVVSALSLTTALG